MNTLTVKIPIELTEAVDLLAARTHQSRSELIRQALVAPRKRIATRPTLGSKRRRLAAKTQRGTVKSMRGRIRDAEGPE